MVKQPIWQQQSSSVHGLILFLLYDATYQPFKGNDKLHLLSTCNCLNCEFICMKINGLTYLVWIILFFILQYCAYIGQTKFGMFLNIHNWKNTFSYLICCNIYDLLYLNTNKLFLIGILLKSDDETLHNESTPRFWPSKSVTKWPNTLKGYQTLPRRRH